MHCAATVQLRNVISRSRCCLYYQLHNVVFSDHNQCGEKQAQKQPIAEKSHPRNGQRRDVGAETPAPKCPAPGKLRKSALLPTDSSRVAFCIWLLPVCCILSHSSRYSVLTQRSPTYNRFLSSYWRLYSTDPEKSLRCLFFFCWNWLIEHLQYNSPEALDGFEDRSPNFTWRNQSG